MSAKTRKALELAREALTDFSTAFSFKAIAAIDDALKGPVAPVAGIWDEAYRQGVADERTSEANIGIAGFGAKVNPARQNPYRGASPAAPVAPAGAMTAPRAAYFMRRFKHEEKMLGPNEQAALDFVITVLEAPVAQPVSDITALQAELWKLAVRKGLVTVHTERVSPTDQRTKVSWLEGHAKACDVSNDAAHGITKEARNV